MNYLVYLEAQASELEKILSGVKSMLIREFDPVHCVDQSVAPGDCLYFLRDEEDCVLRVKATVQHVLFPEITPDEDLSQLLKEVQAKLQLTEVQYSNWAGRGQIMLVEFTNAHKITPVRVAADKISNKLGWMAFDNFTQITE